MLSSLARNSQEPKLKWILKILWVLLRISQFFSKMRYLNPGFGGPWDMLGIFFVNVIFITLQKSLSAKKKIEFHTWVQKCHLPELKNCQNGTFEPMYGIQKILADRLFLKCYENDIYKKIFLTSPRVHQIQDLGTSF